MDSGINVGSNFFSSDVIDEDIPDHWPAVGSDQWLIRLISRLLSSVHEAAMQKDGGECLYGESGDPDKYVHLQIPSRHRRLHRLLGELARLNPQLAECLDPRREDGAVLVQRALKAFGIDAVVRIRYADMNEERVIL